MPRKSIWQEPFDPNGRYVAIKNFWWRGTRYLAHQHEFDVREAPRRARQMYEARLLKRVDEPSGASNNGGASASAGRPVSPEPKPAQTEPETFSAESGEDFSHATSAHIVHRGRGWYDVVTDEGVTLNGKRLRKQAAEELASNG